MIRFIAINMIALLVSGALADPPRTNIFAKENLIAWCIVPYDGGQRTPEQRAAMLDKLGIHKFAYDYRAKHLPTFDAEITALEQHQVELSAVWFPDTLNADAQFILKTLRARQLHPQLWVASYPKPLATDDATADAETSKLLPVVEAAAAIGSTVGLYNHGGWFGVPEHQLILIHRLNALGLKNVGMVYNFHHAHEDIARFPKVLAEIKSYLLEITLNGMVDNGDKTGREILPIGYGNRELAMLRAIRESGYAGPLGILCHTNEDAEARLRDNMDGLKWLTAQLDGAPTRPAPRWQTNPLAQPTN